MNGPASVLVVDDQAEVCDVVQLALEAEGYRVESARDARAAWRRAAKTAFDLAIIDAILPRTAGLALATKFAARGTRVVMMTGSASAHDELIRLGRFPVLRKPFRMSELVQQARDELKRKPPPAA